ncbi:beta strand repeat-containing protein [Luteolibacter luteus]|uniref:beta strand repeat-containing protein n=1 Tax=Luteolibacter luteus TaxID=2728835 RepID=UPI00197B7553|nr:calcium-binding protein [Luteolibacter luteus]
MIPPFTRSAVRTLAGLLPVCLGLAAGATPQLRISKSAGTNMKVSWFAEAGVSYQLQTNTDVVSWVDLGAPVPGANATVEITVSTTGKPRAYFRLKPPPPDVITAAFTPGSGVLVINGGNQDNAITVSRDAAGNLRVNGGAVIVTGGTPTVANTTRIDIFGLDGDDQLSLDESLGAIPPARLFGGNGNDALTGGSGADFLDGGAGNDSLLGKGGIDNLLGGDGNDSLAGGDANDQVSGGNNDDTLIWNPGDDTDLNEGDGGTDTIVVNGGNGSESFTTTANGTRVRFDRITPAPFALDLGTAEKLVLNCNGGDDSFSTTGNLAALIQITVDGGAGVDTLLGSNGADLLFGGEGNDFIDGQQGNDIVFLGGGDDAAQWDPGDGSDVIEGQGGSDTLLFNGSNANENMTVVANGGRVLLNRDIGSIMMDLNDLEIIELNSIGGTDSLTVNDLTGTDVSKVIADLAATGGAADAQADNVIIHGTTGDDIVTAVLVAGDLAVSGAGAQVMVDGFDTTVDTVRILALGGEDVVDASAVPPGGPRLLLDGGAGNDILLGSAEGDTLLGGDNDDVLIGGGGVDVLDGGTGESVLLDGGTNPVGGIVTLFGDAADNTITLSRNAGGALLSNGVPIPGATVANTTLVRIFGRGGNDTLTLVESNGVLPATALFGGAGNDTLIGGSGADLVFGGTGNDTPQGKGGSDFLFGGAGSDTLTGGDADDQVFGEADTDRMIWNPGDDTDLNEGGGGSDTAEVNGGNGIETFTATANGTRVRFDRLDPAPFSIDIGTTESLAVNANGGDDSFSTTGNLAALIQIVVDGGTGADTILGSNGVDILLGGDGNDFIDGQQGNDIIFLGIGDDVCRWDPGDGSDTIEGQAGSDTLLFNGSNANENYTVSPNGGRVTLNRDIGSIFMDVNDVEIFDLNPIGGTDGITVNDLSGTDLTTVIADLAATGGIGDSVSDTVTLNGTAAADAVSLTAGAPNVTVTGLPATVRILQPEAANDRVIVNGLGGADTFSVGAGVTGLIGVTTNQ